MLFQIIRKIAHKESPLPKRAGQEELTLVGRTNGMKPHEGMKFIALLLLNVGDFI